MVSPEHILNSAVDTYNLRIDNSAGRRHALARGGPRGQPRSTAQLASDEDAKLLLKDPTMGPTLAHHNILRGMMKNMSLIMHSEDTRHLHLAELNRGIEAWLRTAVDTNMYLTPYRTAVSAFGLHQDSMDVIIVQVAGKKTWSVYPTIFRSPDSGHTLPELFQAPLNQGKVLRHVEGLHRKRADSSARFVHKHGSQTRSSVASAASSYLAGTVSSTFAQGTKPFAAQPEDSSGNTTWVKLPINITLSPGDVLYFPHGTPHAAMPVPGDTPPGINDRQWDANMEHVMHTRTNLSNKAMNHGSSLTHHLTIGLLYSQQRMTSLLETAMEVCVRRRLLSPEARDAVNMATKYLRQEEEDVLTMGGAGVDTLNVYGNASGSANALHRDGRRSFMGQVLQDDMRAAAYSQDALPALLRSVVYTNVLAPRSMFPAFHPCHPRRTFYFQPGQTRPLSVKVDMACSVVSYGADSAPEMWREWSKDEVREAARELEDLVAANKRKALHRWTHVLVALRDLLADSGAAAAGHTLTTLFGLTGFANRRSKADPASSSADAALARITCGDSAVFDVTELATHCAHSWLVERSSHTQAQSSNFGRLVTPQQLDEANERLAKMERFPEQYTAAQLRHARIAARTPEFWDELFPQPAFVMDAGQVNTGSAPSVHGGDAASDAVLRDIAAENAGVSPIAAARHESSVRHDSTLFRRRSDVPAMMVGSLPERRNLRLDESVLNSYYARFFGSASPMLAEAGLTTEHLFGTVDSPETARTNSSIALAAMVSTSTNLCVGARKRLRRLDSNFHQDDASGGAGAVPMLAVYNADVLRFRSPELAATAQAMVSYPPGIPFTPLDACVEGLVQLRRQDAMFFANDPSSADADTSPRALLRDWGTCNDMNSTLSDLASLLAKLDAIVLDSGTAPMVYAAFSLSEHEGQRLRNGPSTNTLKRMNKRIKKRYSWAEEMGSLLGIEPAGGTMPPLQRFLISNSSEAATARRPRVASAAGENQIRKSEATVDGSAATDAASALKEGISAVSWETVEAVKRTLQESGIL